MNPRKKKKYNPKENITGKPPEINYPTRVAGEVDTPIRSRKGNKVNIRKSNRKKKK